ncbi:hypothetical protein BDM02DRAFT_3130587 [Thelephora ganbajun]|uniref:Uncharacterized protein n=1 Tax=Thelephora ganbajun TaxID=370292 RepID=A0ACB6Z9S2_THEGA|nr:hypothetical protein BDM02DRAFT_3130587 [Thelephora ganbajun]
MLVDLVKLEDHLFKRSYIEGVFSRPLPREMNFLLVRVSKLGDTAAPSMPTDPFPIFLTHSFDYRLTICWSSRGSGLTRSLSSFISYTPSQADVTVFKALSQDLGYPNVARWYKHIKSYEAEFSTLSGSSSAGVVFAGEAAPAEKKGDEAGDDDIDLFRSDEEEDAEAEKLKAERVAAYNAKKANKSKAIAKDDETDLEALEKAVRSIEQEGLVWGNSKFVVVGYGIKKLQITLVIEDELVSLDELQERITEFEDYVQSTDVAAMQKCHNYMDPKRRHHFNMGPTGLYADCVALTASWVAGRFSSVRAAAYQA